jgi:molecular chaperone GrpE
MNNDLIEEQGMEQTEEQHAGESGETVAKDTRNEKSEGKDTHHKPKEKKDQKHDKLAEELAQANDKYLRLYSEFDNYRKRTLKEKIELSKMASGEIIARLLPVVDDFERAINAFNKTEGEPSPLKDGIILIYTKLLNILIQQGLEQMKTIGEEFNTDFHEAITNIPAPTPELKGRIIDEIEKGYILSGKVIRYAKVVVGS